MSHPKNQHYVPQFLLEQFTKPGTDQLFAFDKLTGRSFPTNIRNVAAEKAYYDITFEDAILTLEPSLSRVETNAAGIIQRLLEH